ncbi:metallophosphoesterase [Parvicella tangerina]|uniref:3',5'-cyclic adenosine monophosphate phosphodiesterase CpdA n=1 Tax=Parvicella tangerina TaxID=2829795 RepID=A0A916JQT2_9FLAO|nr:metallophosphoesterase [Parvicella tangerina]CAG5086868.1 3',5'-cyclic adenosine monophosphate phosphodiesterase CpdA [Parvicella tangerina]
MVIFSIVLFIYLLAELYIFFNLKLVVRQSRWSSIYWSIYALSFIFVVVSISSMMLSFNTNETAFTHRTPLANFLLGLTFTIIFTKIILASLFILIDLSRAVTWVIDQIVQLFDKNSTKITLEGRRSFLIKSGLALAAIPFASFLYGITFGKYNYKVKRITLKSSNLNPAFDGYKIVQISDIHAGSFDSQESVLRGVKLINEQDPDLVVFTGDLVNDRAEEIDNYIDVFKNITSKDGVLSITGNHDYGDYYQWDSEQAKKDNFERLIQKHEDLGFDLLMNESRKITRGNEHINIVGIENWGLPPFPQKGDLNKALDGVDDSFTVLLSHDPSHWDEQTLKHPKHIDLTLSGHTHGMQFGVEIPGIKWSPVKYRYPRWAGLYEEQKQHLYVNRGFGFLGLPGRVGIWPEITVIELTSEA